jgi:hypothetical protein
MRRRTLPGGRGQQPNQASQLESFDRRRETIPKQDGWIVSPLDANYERYCQSAAPSSSNVLYFLRLPVLTKDVLLAEVRTGSNASAGHFVRCGVYLFSGESFDLVPGTRAEMARDTAGVLTAKVSGTLRAKKRYFVGTLSTSAVAMTVARSVTAYPTENIRSCAATKILNKIALEATSKGIVLVPPMVSYFSEQAVRIV